MLSHWPCFTLKFFMIWFHKILKSVYQKQPPCPRNTCTGHWWKLTWQLFWKFCYTLRTTCRTCIKSFVNCAVHLFPRQNKVFTMHLVNLIVLHFYFDLVLPFCFLKRNDYFSAVKICQILHVIFESTSQFSFKFCINP